jgi:hypothetical protein
LQHAIWSLPGHPYKAEQYIEGISRRTLQGVEGVAYRTSRPLQRRLPTAHLREKDGFVLLPRKETEDTRRNTEYFRNECSPFSSVELPQRRSDAKLLVDSQYGRAFDFLLAYEAALYGRTDDLAAAHKSGAGAFGYLRVPYRCVPRRYVTSRAEVEAVLDDLRDKAKGSLTDVHILLRGQTREYYLDRSREARLATIWRCSCSRAVAPGVRREAETTTRAHLSRMVSSDPLVLPRAQPIGY